MNLHHYCQRNISPAPHLGTEVAALVAADDVTQGRGHQEVLLLQTQNLAFALHVVRVQHTAVEVD